MSTNHLAFSETNSRYVLVVREDALDETMSLLSKCSVYELGRTGGDRLVVKGQGGEPFIDVPVADLVTAHCRSPL